MRPNLEESLLIKGLTRFAGDKPAKTDVKSRLIDAVRIGAPIIAASLLLRAAGKRLPIRTQLGLKWAGKGFPKTKGGFPQVTRRPIRSYAPIGTTLGIMASLASGYVNADLKNALIKLKKDPSSMNNALEKLRGVSHINQAVHDFYKSSSWGSVVGGTTRALGAGATIGMGRGGTRLAQRMVGRVKPFGISHHVFGAAVKGGAAYGLYRGAKAVAGINRKPEANYTAMLRNNMFAGNIQPGELGQEDIDSVRKLGMR